MLYRLGHLVAPHPVVVLVFWIALAAGVTLTVKQVGANTDNNVSLPGTGSQAATDLLQAGFPPQQNGSNPIIFHIRGAGKVTDKDNKQAITDSYKAIKKIKYVHSATSPFAQGAGAQISKDKKTAFISALLNVSSNDLTEQQAQQVLDAANPGKQAGMEVVGGGSIGSTLSPNDTSTSDVIGILAAMIILTFTFGTVVAMGMPIGTAILGLTTALGVIGLMGHLVSVPDISTTIATMIGLAVGIDYALFLVTRHRGQMREGMELHESIALAVGTAGTAVVFAGCTVVVALLSLFVAGIPLVAALGYTAAVAVGTAVLAAVTLLPKDDPAKEGIWGRWAGFVTRHPLIPVLLAVALMVPLIIPVLSLELGQEDIGQTNPASMQRRAYDLMSRAYGPGFNGPLIIAVAVAPKAKGDPKVVDQENQLKSLQKTLKQEQKEGKQQQAEISSEQAQLEQQQAQLEHKQAQLNQQSASLKAQQAQLEQQQAALEAQGARLQAENNQLNAEQNQLEAQAAALKQDAKALAVRLVANRAEQAKVERKLQKATNPTRIAELQARLKRLRRREQEIIAQLRHDEAEAKKLLREAKSLVAKKEALKQQQQTLEAQSAQLKAQAASLQSQAAALEQQGAALQKQGNELQTQAKDLQQQGDQLKAL